MLMLDFIRQAFTVRRRRRAEEGPLMQRVASEDDLAAGELMRVKIRDRPVCLARADDGQWYAIGDICSHKGYSLSEGDVRGSDVKCPVHASRFSLITGEPDQLPAVKPVPRYPVTVRDDGIYVDVKRAGWRARMSFCRR
jgi:3-phenylpropionate/trans-cinnamate dioxygenase ferredoxin subunit